MTAPRTWPLWRDNSFAVIMGLAAVLSLGRGFLGAAILAAADFGLYALVIAIGAFSSSVLGFGRVEGTRKMFPRLLVDGKPAQIIRLTDEIARLLAWRTAGVALLLTAAAALLGYSTQILPLLLASVFAFAVGWSLVISSAQRAGPDLGDLASISLLRAVLALLFGVGGAVVGGWIGMVVGEIAAALASNIAARIRLGRAAGGTAAAAASGPTLGTASGREAREGLLLFLAITALGLPLYLGRAYVAAVFSPFQLGQFSFVLLFVTAAVTVIGILEQRLGPQLVRMERSGSPHGHQASYLMKSTALLGGLLALGMGVGTLLIFLEPVDYYADKYSLSLSLMIPGLLIGLGQLSTIYDWMLKSRNKEHFILAFALTYLALVAAGCVAVILLHLDLVAFLWILALAKFVQMTLQLLLIRGLDPEKGASADAA
jgi:hypothetical protein